MNIGCTWDCTIRNNGTASYCMPALKELGHTVKHYQAMGECQKHDFYLYVDDGRDDKKWLPPHPNAYWAIDTHLGYGYRLWKAAQFDRVFVAQKDAVEQFKKDGIKHVEWLPLACHPMAHPNKEELISRGFPEKDLTRRHQIAFVGFLNDAKGEGFNSRVDYLDRLFAEFPQSWVAVNLFFEQMAVRFVQAQLGFNISIKQDLNMRCFEVMSTGTPLLTNRNVHGIGDLFEEGVDYFGYEGPDEMVEVAKLALNDDTLRRTIAGTGFNRVRARHTYKHRMETICEVMKHA